MSGSPHDLVFYDGTCGLCHRLVLFALRRDPEGEMFQYAPLGGGTFGTAFPPDQRAGFPDSIVVRTGDGRTLFKSEAVLHLGGPPISARSRARFPHARLAARRGDTPRNSSSA